MGSGSDSFILIKTIFNKPKNSNNIRFTFLNKLSKTDILENVNFQKSRATQNFRTSI